MIVFPIIMKVVSNVWNVMSSVQNVILLAITVHLVLQPVTEEVILNVLATANIMKIMVLAPDVWPLA